MIEKLRSGPQTEEVSAISLLILREMYDNPGTRFKSEEQAKAVQTALEGEQDMLAILPTGGGKSLVFQLPAWAEKHETTVVIVPFVCVGCHQCPGGWN